MNQTIRIHIFPTEQLEFEIDVNETVIHVEILPEEETPHSVLSERIVLVTTNKSPVPLDVVVKPKYEYIIPSYEQAKGLIEMMKSIITRYGVISVGDLKDLQGIKKQYSDEKLGWRTLDLGPIPCEQGWRLIFPDPVNIV